jgi:hypothetical protein
VEADTETDEEENRDANNKRKMSHWNPKNSTTNLVPLNLIKRSLINRSSVLLVDKITLKNFLF